MKVTKKIIAYMLSIVLLFSTIVALPAVQVEAAYGKSLDDKKACWISYIDIQSYLKDKSESAFRAKVSAMYDKVKANGMDTVIVHARAMGDAFYPSSYYPTSQYISSNRSLGYDPYKIMVDLAHQNGLKFEAWVNPYRLSLSDATTESFKQTGYYDRYKDMILEYKNSVGQTCLALDPGNENARSLIVNGVKEIVQNYAVDGVHFDDYFYVDGMSELDERTKKNHVNQLISQTYATIKATRPACVFGISPAGNLDNARAQGADIDTWLQTPGYVDYIMPQIYWTDNYKTSAGITAMFTSRCKAWQDINKNDVPIYVGLALYRVGENSANDFDWSKRNDNLSYQYNVAYNLGYDGYALFRYEWLEKPVASVELNNLKRFVDSLNGSMVAKENSYVSYSTHVQTFGWQTEKTDGIVAGTSGIAKRLEGIRIQLGGLAGDGGITYRTHVQTYGWQDWVSNGALSGTTGQAKRLEAIQIQLTGTAAEKYDVYYRVHCQTFGWLGWAKNGEPAGTSSYSKRLEAIQIQLVPKGGSAPGSTANTYVSRQVKYSTHVQTFGWQESVYDGAVSGTTGKAKRLEAIKIQLVDRQVGGSIMYRTHCQTYGWLPWVSDGQLSGTTGKAKRLEAIEIVLTGEMQQKYDVCYRVHCQTFGWMPWVKNGELAGTTGKAKRLEGIQIKIVPKGTKGTNP